MRMKTIILVGLACLALAVIAVLLFAKDIEIRLQESDIQDRVNAQIATEAYQSLGVSIEVNQADIDFTTNNRIAITIDFQASGFGQSARSSGTLSSGLRYDAPQIFLNNIHPGDMQFEWDDASQREFGDIAEVARDLFNRQREAMSNDTSRAALDRLTEQNRARIEDAIRTMTQGFFQNIPIYNLNDAGTKGSLASLALKDVRFEDDVAIIVLSPRQAMLKILGFLSLCLIVLGYVLLQLGLIPFGSARRSTQDT